MTTAPAPTPCRVRPAGVLVSRCETLLGAIFLWASVNKLRPPNGPDLFAESIHAFKIDLPDVLTKLGIGVIPWVELISSVALLLGICTRGAALVLSALLVLFIALISQALLRHLNVECGCFGKLSPFCPPVVGPCNLVQNGILLAMGLCIILARRPQPTMTA